MEKISKNNLGLTIGILFVIVHAAWLVLVATGLASSFLNFIFSLHFISINIVITSFDFMPAVALLFIAFISGYISGWLIAALLNWVNRN